jgi:hypothetical protein
MKKLTSIFFAFAIALSLTTGCSDDAPPDPPDVDAPPPVDDYTFRADAPGDYPRIDRVGMPAINTAVITSKDNYNMASPADDANGDFVTEIVTNVGALHTALDDDLANANLTPCTVVGDGTGSCVMFAAPLVVPDVLKIDPAMPAGFPNGRMLSDPVMDVTLAVVLLELLDGTHEVTDLVGVLNPTANDVAFDANFPYVAPAH